MVPVKEAIGADGRGKHRVKASAAPHGLTVQAQGGLKVLAEYNLVAVLGH